MTRICRGFIQFDTSKRCTKIVKNNSYCGSHRKHKELFERLIWDKMRENAENK